MRAVSCESFGAPPVVREVPEPVLRPGHVVVRQAFTSITAGDGLMAAGRPVVLRPVFAAMLRPPILGREVAGVVEAVGEGVTGLAVGDRVIGEAGQAWAERVRVPEGALARVPEGVDLREAATLPVSAVTALQGLRLGGLDAGHRVLVVGASGGVGHVAVQLAVDAGARVTGVCSAAKADGVRALGAERVIDHRTERFTDDLGAWDLILDLAGAEPVGATLRALAPGGVLVCSAGINGGPWLGPLPRLVVAGLRSLVDGRIRVLTTSPDPADLRVLLEALQDGTVRPSVEAEVDLDGVPEALARLRRGEVRGKVVVRVAP